MNGESVEADTMLGKFKVTSANLNTLITVLGFVMLCVTSYVLFMHTTDAKELGSTVAKELKEANKEVAGTLKESNKEISRVLSDLAAAMRERNCLDAFDPAKRAQNAELCKRISR